MVEDDDRDAHIPGLRPFSATATFSSNLFAPLAPIATQPRRVRWIPCSIQRFGVEWWPEQIEWDATFSVSPEDGNFTLDSTSPITTIKAEWWRRLGFKALSLTRLG